MQGQTIPNVGTNYIALLRMVTTTVLVYDRTITSKDRNDIHKKHCLQGSIR